MSTASPMLRSLGNLVLQTLLGLIRLYKVLTYYLPHRCRFYPSCSTYLYDALLAYGVSKGLGLGVGRLCRCHPLHPGGLDPLP